jgi:hypothetical protein
MLSIEDESLSYEFDIFNLWATEDGRVFMATDSGCSCPTPFEAYEGDTQEEAICEMERVGSVDQAVAAFKAWNKGYDGAKTDGSNALTVATFVKEHLKN